LSVLDVVLKTYSLFVCSQTAIYASGVGLGASKGKEVGKYQDGYTGYVNMAKDSVSHYPFSSDPLVSPFFER
jgi:hypothetical protein